ncbi:MAG: CxxxxCH/CxxCH domain-containing protein [Deltaproteobacteria bacterium]|nr:MAG: CxxxxCH/CxxCH domain-containing protein [Deltaproteobacteria bacterium]
MNGKLRTLTVVSAVVLLALAGLVSQAGAATVGPKNPTAAAGTNWGTPTNAYTSNNGYATYAALTTQDYLRMTGFAMGVPSNARIDGIAVAIEGYNTNATAANRQIRVALTKDGTAAAGTPKTGVQLATADGVVNQGGAADLWGTTWTVAELNAGTFGVLVSDTNATAGGTFNIDTVTVTVTYTLCNAAPTVTFAEADQTLTIAGSSVAYTATVLNNDPAGCPSYSFALTANETAGNAAGFNSSVSPVTVGPLAPGASTTATLTVQHGTAANGDTVTTTVSAAEASHTTGTSAARVTTLTLACNVAPTVAVTTPPQGIFADNGSVTYNVSITSNDQPGCANTSYALSAADSGAPKFTSALPASTNVLVPGGSQVVVLTVTEATALSGETTTTTITATAAGHPDGTAQVTTSFGGNWVDSPLLHNSDRFPASTKWTAQGGWGKPGTKYGAINCDTCHAKKTGNIKRIRKTVTAPDPSAQFPLQADATPPGGNADISFLDARDGSSDFGSELPGDRTGGESKRICNACHTYDASQTAGVKYQAYSMGADQGHYSKADCTACHKHNQGFKPAGCNTCHGDPPTVAGELVSGADATGSTTAGAHQAHVVTLGFACSNCHNGYVMPNGGDIDINFSNFGSTTGSYTGQNGVSYNGAAGTGGLTCNTVYCHSTGQSANGASAVPSAYSTPSWTGAAACGSCHSNVDPATGSHTAHINDGIACAACHAGNIHVNRVIDVSAGAYTAAGAPGNGYGTCATAACHDDGTGTVVTTPTWGTSAACSECHATVPATAGHTTHLGKSFAGAAIACGDCHAGTTQGTTAGAGHRDGNIDATGYATANKALGTAYTTCTTASCHQTGISANNYVTTPAWDADTANCTQCHAAVPATGSHAKHVTTAGQDCSACHTGATRDVSYNSAAHGDLNIDVAVGGYAPNKAIASAYTNCTNLACHSDGMTATGNSPVWGTAGGCASCHASNMATGSHAKHLAEAGVGCGDCHADAVKDSTAPTGGVHADGNVDVYNAAAGDLGYPNNVAYGSATWTTCSAASCHDMGRGGLATTPTWGTAVTNCTECHAGSAIATGSHGAHLAAGATCTSCHDAATSVATETEPAAGHRDTNIDTTVALGYTQNKAKNSAFTTCATASCHNDGRNSGLTGTWGTTLNNCSECHATVPATAGHATHLGKSFAGAAIACGDCHAGTTQGTTAGAGHRDGNIDATGYATANKALGTAYTTCTTASCHQTGISANNYVTTPAWDADTANCTQCHAAVPATGSHAKHVTTAGQDCSACHTGATRDVSYNSAAHGDLNIDVAVGGYAANKVIGTAFTSCSAVTCHSDGMAASGNTPVWGTASGCAACHLSDMTTGSHAKHLSAGSLCGDCHADAVKDSTAPTGGVHADGNVDVYNTAAGDLGYPNNVAYGSATWTTCNAASCHDPGRGALVVTPAWGVSRTDCTECHLGTTIATGSHAAHLAAGATCASCHDDAANPATETNPAAGHIDTNIDTDLALGYTQNKAKNSAFTTCATASCHNDGRNSGLTAAWGTTLNNCSECHATAPTTGSHSDHSALYACGTCHTGTTQGTTAGVGHRDGNIDTAASTGLAADKLNGSAFTSCGTSNCHGSNSPVWGTDLDTFDACTQCHGQMVAAPATEAQKAPGGSGVDTNGDSAATDAQVGAHQIHLNPTKSKAVACVACHVVPATITAAGHIDSALPAEITFGGLARGGLDGKAAFNPASCATTYCHDGSALKNGGTWDNGTLAPVWTDSAFMQGTVADCDNCHGYPPAGAHPANSDCSVCHDVLNADDVTFTAAGKLTHVDGIVQASGGDSCSDCHAADIDGALNGVHAKHANVATFLAGKTISGGGYGGAGWYATTYTNGQPMFGCGECHPASEGVSHPLNGLNVDLDPAGETPTAGSLKLKNTNGPATPTYLSRSSVTCNNVYCHSDAAGATPSYKLTPNWYGGTVSGNCTDCHGNSPTTNAHARHAVGIHYDTLYDDDGVGLMATAPTGKAASAGADAAHGNSLTSNTLGCQSCHNSTVAVAYNAANTLCGTCHSDTNTPVTGNEKAIISTTGSTHVNGLPDVVFATLTGFKSKSQLRNDITTVAELNNSWGRNNGYKAVAGTSFDAGKAVVPGWNSGAKTCSTVDCHNGIVTPAWTSGSTGNCQACHTSLPQ